MKPWLEANAKAIQAFAGLVTMLVAIAALIGVKVQIDAGARQAREQSARDIYREFLNLSIGKPEFADPDFCAIKDGPNLGAYENYVEYMLYTGDQLLSVSPTWEATMAEHLAQHREYLCTQTDWSDDSPQIQTLMRRFQGEQCKGFVTACGGA